MTTTPAADTALDRFIALKAEIDRMLGQLAGASADHFGVDPDAVNWGHVGSLGYVAERLREACQHIDLPTGKLPG